MRASRTLIYWVFLLASLANAQTPDSPMAPIGPVVKISFATLAPKSAADGKALSRMVMQLSNESGYSIRLNVFYGGSLGDEGEIVEKIRAGQLDGAAFTGNGLGRISGDSRVLEIPGLFRTSTEVDYVYPRIESSINAFYEKKGFHLLCLAEMGFAYFFSKKPIANIAEVRKTKQWVWKGDELAKEIMNELKLPAMPLNLTEVNSSLQTGLLEGVYSTPTGAAALQWIGQVSFMLDMPITMVSGGLVMSLDAWKSMNDAQRAVFTRVSRQRIGDLIKANRRNNAEAIRVFRENGLKILPNAEPSDLMEKAGLAIESRLSGKLFPAELAVKARALVSEYRQKYPPGGAK